MSLRAVPRRARRARGAGLVPPGARSAAVVVPVALTVLAGAGLALAPARNLARMAPTEDGFYSLGIARQIALGHGITSGGGVPTDGFQPLWVFLCAPLYALVDGDRILGLRLTQVLGTVLWLAFAAAMAVLARDLARRHGGRGDVAAALAGIVALGSLSVFRVFHNGLETGLLLTLLAAGVAAIDRIERWTPARASAVGLLLGAVVWARLDAVAFVVAFAAVALWRARRARAAPWGPLAACAAGGALLVPWLAWNVSVDGHPVPTSGRALVGVTIDAGLSAHAALRAAAAWIAPPVLRPSLHPDGVGVSDVAAVAAVAILVAAVVAVRRRARAPLGAATVALWGYVAFVGVYYVVAQGAFWFLDRYLAVVLVAALPWLATAGEIALGDRPRGRALGTVALATAVLNLPLFGVMLAAPREPPAWAARDANTGTHPNVNFRPQTVWTLTHVARGCRVGAVESGTLGYFRDDVVNLDGKVNADALRAIARGRRPAYVRAQRIDVLVDIPPGVRAAAGTRSAWRAVARLGRFAAWVRRGHERCVATAARPRAPRT